MEARPERLPGPRPTRAELVVILLVVVEGVGDDPQPPKIQIEVRPADAEDLRRLGAIAAGLLHRVKDGLEVRAQPSAAEPRPG